MPVQVSARSLLIFISGRIFYSSMIPSEMDHAGMYMYSYLIGLSNGVMR